MCGSIGASHSFSFSSNECNGASALNAFGIWECTNLSPLEETPNKIVPVLPPTKCAFSLFDEALCSLHYWSCSKQTRQMHAQWNKRWIKPKPEQKRLNTNTSSTHHSYSRATSVVCSLARSFHRDIWKLFQSFDMKWEKALFVITKIVHLRQ